MPLPSRWTEYSNVSQVIPGTRFIAFKVPLRENSLLALPEERRFSPSVLIQQQRDLGLVIDLTNTAKYYNEKQEFVDKGIRHKKILCPGRKIPNDHLFYEFVQAVEDFRSHAKPDGIIGVHCTHGLNRTGYFICRYMIERLGFEARTAISAFEAARGHRMERENYVMKLYGTVPVNPNPLIDSVPQRESVNNSVPRPHPRDDRNFIQPDPSRFESRGSGRWNIRVSNRNNTNETERGRKGRNDRLNYNWREDGPSRCEKRENRSRERRYGNEKPETQRDFGNSQNPNREEVYSRNEFHNRPELRRRGTRDYPEDRRPSSDRKDIRNQWEKDSAPGPQRKQHAVSCEKDRRDDCHNPTDRRREERRHQRDKTNPGIGIDRRVSLPDVDHPKKYSDTRATSKDSGKTQTVRQSRWNRTDSNVNPSIPVPNKNCKSRWDIQNPEPGLHDQNNRSRLPDTNQKSNPRRDREIKEGERHFDSSQKPNIPDIRDIPTIAPPRNFTFDRKNQNYFRRRHPAPFKNVKVPSSLEPVALRTRGSRATKSCELEDKATRRLRYFSAGDIAVHEDIFEEDVAAMAMKEKLDKEELCDDKRRKITELSYSRLVPRTGVTVLSDSGSDSGSVCFVGEKAASVDEICLD